MKPIRIEDWSGVVWCGGERRQDVRYGTRYKHDAGWIMKSILCDACLQIKCLLFLCSTPYSLFFLMPLSSVCGCFQLESSGCPITRRDGATRRAACGAARRAASSELRPTARPSEGTRPAPSSPRGPEAGARSSPSSSPCRRGT